MTGKTEELQEIIDNLRRIFQVANEYSRSAETETGLTGPQLWALKILAEAAPLRLSELARRMYIRSATAVGIIDRLAAKELVSKTQSVSDRRAVDLVLTEKGKSLVAGSPQSLQSMLLKGLNALPEEQFEVVAQGVRQLVKVLGAESLTPQPLHRLHR